MIRQLNTGVLLAVVVSGGGVATSATPELVPQVGHSSDVKAVAFSPDGKHIVTGSQDNTVKVWDAKTGRLLRSISGHSDLVGSVMYSPDGEHILTGSDDRTAKIWDARTGRLVRSLRPESGTVYSARYSPDGKRICAGASDRTAYVWDAESGRQLLTLKHSFLVSEVAYSPDGNFILTASDKIARVWDANTGELALSLKGHASDVQAVAYSPDGKYILTGSYEESYKGTVKVWDAKTGRLSHSLKSNARLLRSIAYSPDGKSIVTGSSAGTVELWNALTGRLSHSFVMPGDSSDPSVDAVAYSPEGVSILTGSSDHSARVWNAKTGRLLLTLRGDPGGVDAAAYSPDGKSIFVGSNDRMVRIWDGMSGQLSLSLKGATGWGEPTTYSFDGNSILTGSLDGTINVWNARSGRLSLTFKGHTECVTKLALSPDRKSIVTSSWDRSVKVWDAQTGRLSRTLVENSNYADALAYSPDGRTIVAGSMSGMRMWDARTGQEVGDFKKYFHTSAVAYSPDSKSIVVCWLGGVEVLNSQTGQVAFRLQGQSRGMGICEVAVAYSPDGKSIVTGSRDNVVRVSDARTGQLSLSLKGHTSTVSSVAYRSDGKQILTGSYDNTCRLWDARTGEQLATLFAFEGGTDWLVTTPEGLFDGSPNARDKVCFRVGDGLNVVPVDRFFTDFYHPGLLAEIVSGQRPKPWTDFAAEMPPKVRIISPERSGPTEDRLVSVEVEATDQGGGVTTPWLMHNGSRVQSDQLPVRDGKSIRRTFDVLLVSGENRLEFISAGKPGVGESEPATITFRYLRAVEKPTLHLVAVGVSKYSQPAFNLKYAAGDASSLAELFRTRGGGLYADVSVSLLLNEKATRKGIRDAFSAVAQKAEPQDVLMVCLAGHGTTLGKRYYFIPADFRRDADRLEDDVRKQGMPADELADLMEPVAALKRILILDTCGSGSAIDLIKKTDREPFALRGAVERLNRNHGVFAIAAAASSQQAKEVDELKHGLLSYALLAGMRAVNGGPLAGRELRATGPGQTTDVLSWLTYASNEVPVLMKKYFDTEQDVQMSASGASFPVLPVRE